MYNEPKFSNIIPGINLATVDSELIGLLISKAIIFEYTPDTLFQRETESTTNSTSFDTEIRFNSKCYELNEAIYEEIYEQMALQIERLTDNYMFESVEITVELNGFITIDEKINYLKEKHRLLYDLANREPEFLIFSGIKEFNGFSSWREIVIEDLRTESDLIKTYITTELRSLPISRNLQEMWLRYGKVHALTATCNDLLADLTGQKPQQMDETGTKNSLDSAQKVLLFDRMMRYDNWAELSISKKAFLLNKLTGSNQDNLRKYFSAMEHPKTPKAENDYNLIDSIMKELGNQ